MSAHAIPVEEGAEAYQESLTERMGRGRLSLAEALRFATQIATCLRDLHAQHLVYGAVSSQLIQLSPSGATLRSTGGLTRLGDGHHDVASFGAVLSEMLRRMDGPEDLRAEIEALAMRCREEAPDMQQVLITLRLLTLQARQGAGTVRRPLRARAPKRAAKTETESGRRLPWQWKPLANLAALGLWGK
jgi:hypothetical protein